MIKGTDTHSICRERYAWTEAPTVVVAGMRWSISRIRSFRELLATGEGECRALIDTMANTPQRSDKRIEASKILAMKPAEVLISTLK